MVRIQYAVDAGSGVNEDITAIGEEHAILLDGATGLTEESYTDGPTDGRWYVEALSEELSDRIPQTDSLSRAAERAIGAVQEQYNAATSAVSPPPEAVPSASGAIIDWSGGELTYFILGDCSAILQTATSVIPVIGRGPRTLDEQVLDRMIELREADPELTQEELWDRVIPQLREHRMLKNDPDGYWVFSLDPEAVNYAMEGGEFPCPRRSMWSASQTV
ncbi:hypothetical protein [Halocatena halophila]|uniref:hypothetical protein n=1 Tax=Halocatena halophila TaxID=2814576 RepID=UPI002ED66CAB